MTATTPPEVERCERLMAAAARGDAAMRRLGWRLRAVTPARLVRFLLVVVALATIAWLIIAAWATLLPFLVGALLAYVLLPLMTLLDRWFGGGVRDAVLVIAHFVVVQNIQDNILRPRIMGQSLNIHPAIVMPLVLIIGRYGLLWIILAGAVAALARDLFLYVYRRFGDPPRPAGVLPGEPVPASVAADAASSATTAEPSSGGRGCEWQTRVPGRNQSGSTAHGGASSRRRGPCRVPDGARSKGERLTMQTSQAMAIGGAAAVALPVHQPVRYERAAL